MSPEPFVSRAKAPPVKRSEKSYGDENDTEPAKPVLWSTNIVDYLYSLRALFVLHEARLDNKINERPDFIALVGK